MMNKFMKTIALSMAMLCLGAGAAGAALRVADLTEAVKVAGDLVADAHRLDSARQACDTFAQAHRGAAHGLARAIVHVMNASVAGLVKTG